MRFSGFAVGVFLGASLLLGARHAAAYNYYLDGLPNGDAADFGSTNQCVYCHPNGAAGGPRNDFGLLFEGSTDAQGVYSKWKVVYKDNTDGDAASNGLELGDPCGIWTMGGMPQFTEISDPNDVNSTVTTMQPECSNTGGTDSMGPGPAPPLPEYEAGLCAVQGPLGDGASPVAWAAAALGALGALVQRARRSGRRAG